MTMFEELDELRTLPAYQLLKSGEEIRCLGKVEATNLFKLKGDRLASGDEIMRLMECGLVIAGGKEKGRITTRVILASLQYPESCSDSVEEAIFNRYLWIKQAKSDYERQLARIEEWYEIWMRDALKEAQS